MKNYWGDNVMERILIIGAHFDDAELGAGGTAAKLAEDGKKVYKLTLTDNVTRFEQKNIKVDFESSVLQSARACRVLGVQEITDFNPVECSKLMYSKEVMQNIEKIIFKYNFDTVFIHFGTDMNQDHVESSRLCITAARHCRNILEFQSNGYILDNEFYPTYFVDISKYVEKKIEALSQYGSEHNRFDKLFQINVERNHIWGYANEVDYAEGFRIVKMLGR
jgi:N-acetylglucosamine malate deacetylase 1